MQQPFLSGVNLNNEKDMYLHIGKGYIDDDSSTATQASEGSEVGAASDIQDRTYEAVCTFVQDLLLRKRGAAFEKLSINVAGYSHGTYPDVLSVEGQHEQLGGMSHERTFEYEAGTVNGLPRMCFEKRLFKETTVKSIEIKLRGGVDEAPPTTSTEYSQIRRLLRVTSLGTFSGVMNY